ncbi:MAG: benzoate/H(+) symporter BenE family transporter [Ahrensia sp.]|nr:benzoate/H(+) symporter BenE family transporter [Ahrensia sp.]
MLHDFQPQTVFIGALAAFVGFASSFAVVLAGLKGVGANEAEAASGLMAAAIAMGSCGIVLALKTRMPVSVAWSTPGAALLATGSAVESGFSAAVGAFIVCALLIIVAGISRPFGRAIAAIPASLANAMLAGILLSLCLAPFQAIAFDPILGLPILLAWIIGSRINRFAGVPFALLAFVAVVTLGVPFPDGWQDRLADAVVPQPVFIVPTISVDALLGIALPLFVVTMASQNIPGIAVLRANKFETPSGPLLATTGLFSLIFAPFGSHAVNLAAITAAMISGEEAGQRRESRYTAAIVCGALYILFGLSAGVTTAFVSLAPGILIAAVAGLALFASFSSAAMAAFTNERDRPAAAVTFLASASGMSLFGVSGAFWGLLAGGLMLALLPRRTG